MQCRALIWLGLELISLAAPNAPHTAIARPYSPWTALWNSWGPLRRKSKLLSTLSPGCVCHLKFPPCPCRKRRRRRRARRRRRRQRRPRREAMEVGRKKLRVRNQRGHREQHPMSLPSSTRHRFRSSKRCGGFHYQFHEFSRKRRWSNGWIVWCVTEKRCHSEWIMQLEDKKAEYVASLLRSILKGKTLVCFW